MTREKLIERHSTAIKRIGHTRLLSLPQRVKKRLMANQDLESKTILLEGIADRYASRKPKMLVSVDWEVDREEDLYFLPELVPIYEDVAEDEIADYISDRYGFLIKGYTIESK